MTAQKQCYDCLSPIPENTPHGLSFDGDPLCLRCQNERRDRMSRFDDVETEIRREGAR